MVTKQRFKLPTTLNTPVAKAKPLSGKHQIAAMAKLRSVIASTPSGISHQDAIKEVASVLSCPMVRRSTVAKETIDRLIVNGHLYVDTGKVTLK